MARETGEAHVRRPLFDRLVDDERHLAREARPRRTYSRAELRRSVRDELWRLFNTRVRLTNERLDAYPRTVIDYGIPDFGTISARNPADRDQLARRLEESIAAFEPRLQEVTVRLSPPGVDSELLSGEIEAMLVVESVREPVRFATTLTPGSATLDESD